ncbi:riboflavin synthase [Desulfofundulus thermocisternus]|uniref:riboflavin synthase n=1 Tax=Desulfofundulus thermocisternus TaxID=42471 RepID=UPI001A0D028A|nr:riboflavin synthase [Desulfofundulus thermocisternus]MBE3586412.1 riboflavin synthase [Thermoanaerobacter sp.]MCS5696719.1 riboflavin synthase [Desulfofundulus thermocisternus]
MFTGLVEEIGILRHISRGKDSARLTVEAARIPGNLELGDSVAVNGVCLTVVSFTRSSFTVDVMAETLARTNLGHLQPGDRVNLERALRLGDRLGGHLVTGHIDGVGQVLRRQEHDIAILLTIGAAPEVLRYIVKKGSVAVDGTSLTVVDVDEEGFLVSLIPHTARHTILGAKKRGDLVNLETDIIGKYVERFLNLPAPGQIRGRSSGITLDFLAEHGFITR